MATTLRTFKLADSKLSTNDETTLTIVFDTTVINFGVNSLLLKGVSVTNFVTTDNGQSWTGTVTALPDYNGPAQIRIRPNTYFNGETFQNGTGFELDFNVDTTQPLTPTISIESPGADGVYNIEEVGADGSVTATITLPTSTDSFENTKPGDVLTVDGVDYVITQDMIDNGFELEITPETDPTEITASITDAAGNTGAIATQAVALADIQAPDATSTQLVIDDITADNIVNLAEAGSTVPVTGSVTGDFSAGDVVTLSINGTDYTGAVDANGGYSIDVNGVDLQDDANTTIEAQIVATDAAGNTGVIATSKDYSIDTSVLAPTVVITEDANDDGVIDYNESNGDVDFTVTVADDAEVGDTLTLNGQQIAITQAIINNGYQGTVTAVDGQQVDISAMVTDKAGNASAVAQDSATLDLTIPNADAIYLWHLGANLTDSQGPSDQRGKTGGKYGTDINYETGNLNDAIYIGYEGFDSDGNLIVSPWDGDFERDCGDGDVVWTMETYAGNDLVYIREDQNAYTVAKLGAGDDTYYVQGEMDSVLSVAQTNPEARSFIYTESGNDTVVVGGNGDGIVTGWGIDGGRIFTGSGSDNVAVYGEMDDGGVIDLGAGRSDFANPTDADAAITVDSAGDVNTLTISKNLGNAGLYDFGHVFGGAGDDSVTVGTFVEGASVIDLGEGTNSVTIGDDLDGQAKVITGSGNDTLVIGDDTEDYSSINLGDGNNSISIASTVEDHSVIKTGNGDDTLDVGYAIANYADVNLGDGNNTINVADDIDGYSNVRTGNGDDVLNIGDDTEDSSVIDLGDGNNVINVYDALEDHSSIVTGEGNDTLTVGGSTWNVATADLGAGDDTVTIAGKMYHDSKIQLGEGDNDISVDGMYHYSKITAGSGDDNIDLGVNFNAYTYYSHVAVESGAGDDTITFSGGKMRGKISGGEGEDTLVLDYDVNDSLVSQHVHETNASTKNITGIETIELNGQNVIDVRFEDLVQDTDRDGALFIQGDSSSKVDLGSTNWNSDGVNKAQMRDATTDGTWAKADSATVDGVSYDIYHNSAASNAANDVYIEQGIVVI